MAIEIERWISEPNDHVIIEVTKVANVDLPTAATATSAATSAVLASLAALVNDEQSAINLMNVLNTEHVDALFATHPELAIKETEKVRENGRHILNHLFNEQKDGMAHAVSEQAHISHEQAKNALEVVAPAVLGNIKNEVDSNKMSASDLKTALDDQRNIFERLLDVKAMSALGLGVAAGAAGIAAGVANSAKDAAAQGAGMLGEAKDGLLGGGADLARKARESFHKASDTAVEGSKNMAAAAKDSADQVAHHANQAKDTANDAAKSAYTKAEESAKKVEEKLKKGGFPWWILVAIAAVIALLLLLKSCNDSKSKDATNPDTSSTTTASSTGTDGTTDTNGGTDGTSTATTTAGAAGTNADGTTSSTTSTTTSPNISYAWKDGKLVITGAVKDEDSKNNLLKAAKAAFGNDAVVDNITVDSNAPAVSTESSEKLTKWMKAHPGLSLDFNGTTATVTGTVPSTADKTNAGESLESALGSSYTVKNDITVDASSKNDTKTAVPTESNGVVVLDVDFDTGSATIPTKYYGEVKAFAKELKDDKVSGEVGGYTDNTGNAASNMKLSQARADSVRNALIKEGVSADTLTAKGYGSADPIASNDTVDGRNQNRRVTFKRK